MVVGGGNETNVCIYAALFRLQSGVITQTARHRESVPTVPWTAPYTPKARSDMPLASGRAIGAQQGSAPYQRPLSNTRPLHQQNSVGRAAFSV